MHTVLREGQEDAYDVEHATVWPELASAIRASGVTEWIIWRSGRHLFHLVECDDAADAMAHLAREPVTARWGEHMSAFVDPAEQHPVREPGMPLGRVWALSEQLRDQRPG